MLQSILAIFLLSLFTALCPKRFTGWVHACQLITIFVIFGYLCYHLEPIMQGSIINNEISWIDSLDISLSFHLDGLSLFFALLVIGMGFLVVLYSIKYMADDTGKVRFFSFLLFFMGAMLGLVLSANLISLFVFWELTSFSSFLLIGFKNKDAKSRKAARQALLVTAGGGLALMSGFILLALITDAGFSIPAIISQSHKLNGSHLTGTTIILIAIGAMTKSAQFPFHFWLPNAMAAPTPVSAYLHSATMVKAGVYLIFRLNPLFTDIDLWGTLLGLVGAITMTLGALQALQADDLKKILAYTTISALGIFFMMTGLGGEAAINAVMIYVLAHALYKGALFLAIGSIDHQTGIRAISGLSDLARKMPYTSSAVAIALASMAGVIPLLGFVGKESLYEALYHSNDPFAMFYLGLLFLSGTFFTAISIEIIYNTIIKKGPLHYKAIREANTTLLIAPLVLVALSLIFGLIPGITLEPLLSWSAANSMNSSPTMKLKLWHGFNAVLALSVLTLFAGASFYFVQGKLRKFHLPAWLQGDYLYDQFLYSINEVAKLLTRTVQNGYLRNYIAMVMATFCLLALAVIIDQPALAQFDYAKLWHNAQIYEVVIIALITISVLYLFKTTSRLIVTATFGIIGYSIALAFTLFSAPDVAITQFLAETLTLILLILILHKLPSYTLKQSVSRIKYLPVAIAFGSVMALISFITLNQDKNSALKSYFLENSISAGKGANAVNVILVDFRALDTLGEITVLAITMIGIVALLRLKPQKPKL